MNAAADIRVGVIGATGYIGSPYREEMRACPGARIVALCARRRDRLEAAAAEDGADLVTGDWREVVEHPEVNMVVVATPDAHHHEPVMAAAAAGRHLLCEKPIGLDREEARAMWSAYRSRPQLAHFVPFWTRYASPFAKAREIVRAGDLGEIRGVVYRWHNPRPASMPLTWRDDARLSAGGSIPDVGSHAYDTVRWILGDEARRVLVHADTITPPKPDLGAINLGEALAWGEGHSGGEGPACRRGETPDYASVAWEFAGGAVGVLVLSHSPFFRKGLAPELELHGTEASLAVDRVAGRLTRAIPNGEPEVVAAGLDAGFGNRFARHVFPAVRAVMRGDAGGEHPDLGDGWAVQCFTDAALASAASGCWEEVDAGGEPRA